jgi:hypothetical protein
MKRLRKALLILLALSAVFAVTFWIPSAELIAGPKFARLETPPEGVKFGVSVQWWDIILNGQRFSEHLTFGGDGRAVLPVFQIQTSVGRRLSKHILTGLGLWPGCEHCDGPWTYCSLYHLEKYSPPKGMRLAQGQYERDGGIVFTVGLLPDESQFETRPFVPTDQQALVEECRGLIAKGESSSIDPANFGIELKRLNPVRAECSRGAIGLWMGGAIGYAVVPDSDGCPTFDRLWMSGTEMKHIYKLERQ